MGQEKKHTDRWKCRALTTLFFIQLCNAETESDNYNITPTSRFDGWYNNLDKPQWGSAGQGLLRMTYAEYDERPNTLKGRELNPRTLSKLFLQGNTDQLSTNRSVLFAFFGQHLSDDLTDSRRVQCPNQYSNVIIPANESAETEKLDRSQRILPIYRNRYLTNTGTSGTPRALANEATAWLDGSVIYGNSFSWAESLRSYEHGKLRSETNASNFPERNRNNLPLINPIVNRTPPIEKRDPADSFSFGNPRGNENPFLMSIGILWFRYHNHYAKKFHDEFPRWSDEQVFLEARKWTVAIYQNIAMYEWLPLLTGKELPPYQAYNPNLIPGISSEFAIAAMRVGHSLVPSGVELRNEDCSKISPLPSEYGASAGESALRLCNTYWQLQDALQGNGISPVIRGMMWQKAEKDDNIVVEDLSDYLYGPLLRSRMDLETLTIVRGRDAGLPSYNTARLAYGLRPISNFSELNPDLPEKTILQLQNKYENVNRIELYVGGMLEARNDQTGELFSAIIMDQFRRTRDSDRFWFENNETKIFNAAEIHKIRQTKLSDVIKAVTDITKIQSNVFTVQNAPCPITDKKILFNKSCTPNQKFDFFADQWGGFIGVLILVLLFPIISYVVMRILAWKRQQDAELIKRLHANKTAEQTSAKEKTAGKAAHSNNLFKVANPEVRHLLISGRKKQNDNTRTTKSKFTALQTVAYKFRHQVLLSRCQQATEIEGSEKTRGVVVVMERNEIKVLTGPGNVRRKIDVVHFEKTNVFISSNKKKNTLVLRVPKEYDLVLQFISLAERNTALEKIKIFMATIPIPVEVFEMEEHSLMDDAITKEVRQQLLEAFFRRVFSTALQLEYDGHHERRKVKTMDILSLELTRTELAETMGMKPDSLFVQQIFRLADVDKSGYLCYTEFADLLILLMKGSPEEKAKMLFDMYDVENCGRITRKQANAMIRSFLEMAGVKMSREDIDGAVATIFREAGIERKEALTLEDFQYVMLKEHRESFEMAQLSLPGITKSVRRKLHKVQTKCKQPLKRQITQLSENSDSSESEDNNYQAGPSPSMNERADRNQSQAAVYTEAVVLKEEKTRLARWWKRIKRIVENNRRHIVCMVIFYSITIALMLERAMYYAVGSENLGIRRVTEWGIIISRSTAAGISFHFSFILLTMCRNLITFCRETFLKNYIPFDSAVAFHKQIAIVAMIESILHTFGHIVNFYHISVHPLPVVACLFPTIVADDGSDLPPTVITWLFATITGLTGLLLLLTLSVMYIFAMQFSRRFCFRAFWVTHHLYSLLYVLIVLHGSMGLVQAPRFHLFLVVPVGIFLVDRLVTISRSKVQIAVVKSEPLPSNVLNLVFQRPPTFDYKSGQWVRIACLPLGSNEYHPFTLTSAPHERHLSLHIRAAGPWTTNLRHTYQAALDENEKLPLLYLDGPFGEGHQDWYKYEVSVLVGAGIGVTPFASILKDIVNRSTSKKGFQVTCKKVYFIWVTRTQKHFEWLTDIISDLEDTKGGDMVSTHIYITQFSNRFDLRTTMLYICERYFSKVANKSLFTGLRAITHFGRPQFELFLDSLQMKHNNVRTIGVFSCGPPGLTNGVEHACRQLNTMNKARFNHFFENF